MRYYLLAFSLLGLIKFAIFGLVIGALAKLVMPGNNPGGIWITMLLGIAGSLLATWFLQLVGHYEEGETGGMDRIVRRCFCPAGDLSALQAQDGVVVVSFAGVSPAQRTAAEVADVRRPSRRTARQTRDSCWACKPNSVRRSQTAAGRPFL